MKKRRIETKLKILEGPKLKWPIFIRIKNVFNPKIKLKKFKFLFFSKEIVYGRVINV